MRQSQHAPAERQIPKASIVCPGVLIAAHKLGRLGRTQLSMIVAVPHNRNHSTTLPECGGGMPTSDQRFQCTSVTFQIQKNNHGTFTGGRWSQIRAPQRWGSPSAELLRLLSGSARLTASPAGEMAPLLSWLLNGRRNNNACTSVTVNINRVSKWSNIWYLHWQTVADQTHQ